MMSVGRQSYRFELSEPFKARLWEEYGDKPDLLAEKYKLAIDLLDWTLRGISYMYYRECMEEDLFDPNATFVPFCETEGEAHIPFIHAFYMCDRHKDEAVDMVMRYFPQFHNPSATGLERLHNPLYMIYKKPELWNEWEDVIRQPDMNPNTPLYSNNKPYTFFQLRMQGLYDREVVMGYNSQRFNCANILEMMCDDQSRADNVTEKSAKESPWRKERIKELLDTGCIITPKIRKDIRACERADKLKGISEIISNKEARLNDLINGSLDMEELSAQDIKDAYALRMLPPLFTMAQNDEAIAEALLQACSEAPTWLQEEIQAGITLLSDHHDLYVENVIKSRAEFRGVHRE